MPHFDHLVSYFLLKCAFPELYGLSFISEIFSCIISLKTFIFLVPFVEFFPRRKVILSISNLFPSLRSDLKDIIFQDIIISVAYCSSFLSLHVISLIYMFICHFILSLNYYYYLKMCSS